MPQSASCIATHAVQLMQCNPSSATHAVQPIQCNPCSANHAVQPMHKMKEIILLLYTYTCIHCTRHCTHTPMYSYALIFTHKTALVVWVAWVVCHVALHVLLFVRCVAWVAMYWASLYRWHGLRIWTCFVLCRTALHYIVCLFHF